jgi:hypothetical protein
LVQHELVEAERVEAIEAGVLHLKKDGTFIINKGINTLQSNSNLYNQDGSSPEISIERISAQLNYEFILGVQIYLGGNRFSVSEAEILAFARTEL